MSPIETDREGPQALAGPRKTRCVGRPLLRSGGDEEATVFHDLFGDDIAAGAGFEPDVELQAHDIDVGSGTPWGASVLAVRIAEGDVDAGEFFILQDVADDVIDTEVGADGEFANAVGVFVGMGVGPEVGFELLVCAGAGDDAVAGDLDREWRFGEEAVARAEPVADYTVDDKGAVDFSGRGEAFAAGEVAPFFRGDDAGGLEPLIAGVHVGGDVGSGGGGGADARGAANAFEDLLREAVDEVEVGTHAAAHDFRGDVDHVRVAHAAAVDHVGHLHAGVKFVGLHLNGEDGYLRGFHVGEDGSGHVAKRAWREVFEDECIPGASALGKLGGDCGGDWLSDVVGDERYFFTGRDAQTGRNGGAGSGNKFSRVFERHQMRGSLRHE
jgi:hypothetical protein